MMRQTVKHTNFTHPLFLQLGNIFPSTLAYFYICEGLTFPQYLHQKCFVCFNLIKAAQKIPYYQYLNMHSLPVFQIVACLYLVMVMVMVGLNYRLRGRDSTKTRTRASEDAEEEREEPVEAQPIPCRRGSDKNKLKH